MSKDIADLKDKLASVRPTLALATRVDQTDVRDYCRLNENLARAIALLEGKEREIKLLKNQLADYQELLMNKETL